MAHPLDPFETISQVLEKCFPWRRVEYPFAIRHLEGKTVLDLGSVESLLPIAVSKLGLEVIGIDLRRYFGQHFFSFLLADALKLPFKDEAFDQVLSISTTEHVGLISHGLERIYPRYVLTLDSEGDRKNILEMARVTKSGGSIIVTLPYGVGGDWWLRVYNKESLRTLTDGLMREVEEYFYEAQADRWVRCSREDAETVMGTGLPKAIVCLKLRRSK